MPAEARRVLQRTAEGLVARPVATAAGRYVTRELQWDTADFERLLQGAALDRALQQEHDFLHGDEDHEAEYARGSRPDLRLRVLRPTPPAAGWLAGRLGHRPVRTSGTGRPEGTR